MLGQLLFGGRLRGRFQEIRRPFEIGLLKLCLLKPLISHFLRVTLDNPLLPAPYPRPPLLGFAGNRLQTIALGEAVPVK